MVTETITSLPPAAGGEGAALASVGELPVGSAAAGVGVCVAPAEIPQAIEANSKTAIITNGTLDFIKTST